MQPNLYIIAGSNGSGKTTFAREFLPKVAKCDRFINVDDVTREMAEQHPKTAVLKAARFVLKEIRLLASRQTEFAFETTLSGQTYYSIIKKIKERGYRVHFFLWIPSVDLSLARVKDRVAHGGHDVPEPDIRRRFHRGLSKLYKVYLPLLDTWTIYDNSTELPHLIAKNEYGTLEIVDKPRYSQVLSSIK